MLWYNALWEKNGITERYDMVTWEVLNNKEKHKYQDK